MQSLKPAIGLLAGVILTILAGYTAVGRQPHHVLSARILRKNPSPLPIIDAGDCSNTDSQIVIAISKEGLIEINNQPMEKSKLEERLAEIFDGRKCKMMFIEADPHTSFDNVIQIIDIGKGVGVSSDILTEGLRRELGFPPRN